MRVATWVVVVLVLLLGCSGVIGKRPISEEGTAPPADTVSPQGPDSPGDISDAVCSTGAEAAPLRRLTPREYNNSLRDIFSPLTLPEQSIAADSIVQGFDNNAEGQSVSALRVEQFRDAAVQVAALAIAQPDGWAPCTDASRSCTVDTALWLAARAYRRPLTSAEESSLRDFAGRAYDDHDFATAQRLVVEGILQAPQFLYRPEPGDRSRANDGLVPLTGYELATRLSYALWQSMPDQQLLDAAANGQLDTAEGLRMQARRMLQDQRARASVSNFHEQWFDLERLEQFTPDAAFFPEYTPEVREALLGSTRRFLEYAFWEARTLEALMTDRSMFANDALAQVYGLDPPGSEELVRLSFPSDQRAGILTQPGLLASTSHAQKHSPILRGVFVRSAILCAPLPPPPPNVNVTIGEPPDDQPRTTRQHITEVHSQPACSSCHDAIDGVGFTFENYDTLGRFRTEEDGLPVDPSGRLLGISGVEQEEVANAVELAEVISESQAVRECVASHWFRYVLGRSAEDAAARCEIQRLSALLAEDGGDLQEMLLHLVVSDSFRYRPAP